MNWFEQCAAVIPCLNEARTIAAIVQAVRLQVRTVIVVDDGSSDATAHLAREAGAIVLSHKAPQGKGASLREGWKHARNLGCAWVLTLDGDGQHLPADIPAFFKSAEAGAAALVIGNRMATPREIPAVRRWVNRWMSSRLSAIAGQDLPDTQCGFRLVCLDALGRIPLSANHYETESEQVLAFATAGERIAFVPITVIYNGEKSKIRPGQDTVRWFRWLAQWKRNKGHPDRQS